MNGNQNIDGDKNQPSTETDSQAIAAHRLDRIYHVVKSDDADDEDDELILSMTVMENPPSGGK